MRPMNEEPVASLATSGGEATVLQAVRVQATLQGMLAVVELEQTFFNPMERNIEAVYTFPLPAGAVLLKLDVAIAGKRLCAKVVARQEAERRYEDAVTDGDSAVMLEETAPGLYSASLGNMLPEETATIRLSYGILLAWRDDTLRFSLPATIAPRYGSASSAGIADHLAPLADLGVDYPFHVEVHLPDDLAAAAIASPSHDIYTERRTNETVIRLAEHAALDRDFILTVRRGLARACAVVVQDSSQQVLLASLQVPYDTERDAAPIRLKMVIDCSGSMAGVSIAQARKGALAVLDLLQPQDRFDITLFGTQHRHLFGALRPADARSLASARECIGALMADMGGTEMEMALDACLQVETGAGPTQVLLITDGQTWQYDLVMRRAVRSEQRLFTVGVGMSVAEPFIRDLAERTGGAWEYCAPQEGMQEKIVAQFCRMRQQRVYSDAIVWPAQPLWTTPLPQRLFSGDTVHVFAGFAPSAVLAGKPVSLPTRDAGESVCSTATAVAIAETVLPRIAAATRLPFLQEDAARELALQHQLISRWTNYLVVAERDSKVEQLPHYHAVAGMMAAGSSGFGNTRHAIPLFCRKHTAPDEPSFSWKSHDMFATLDFSSASPAATAASIPRTGTSITDGVTTLFQTVVRWLQRQDPGALSDLTLDHMKLFGLPHRLEDIAARAIHHGHAERDVVLALLEVLYDLCTMTALDRSDRRTMQWLLKRHPVPRDTLILVRNALTPAVQA
jgi:Ca-activated chloride channel family protein